MSGNNYYSTKNLFQYADNVQLVHSGNHYFQELKKLISEAKEEIHIQTYIFNTDKTGNEIIDELLKASEKGIKIFLLIDAYGSETFKKATFDLLKSKNIQIRFFAPVFTFKNLHWGRRLHHKIALADGEKAIVGGINIADKYRGTTEEKAWLDYAVLVEGSVCKKLQTICKEFYFHEKTKGEINATTNSSDLEIPVRIRQNDWLHYKNEIGTSYIQSIKKAEKEIIIVGSYFLPGRRFRKALKKASKRGVKVKIILAGVSDVPLVKNATQFFYTFLLVNGIKIYEWEHSILHGKAAVIDKKLSTIGSYNINRLSKYSSIEMNIEIHSTAFSTDFNMHLEEVILKCKNIEAKEFIRKYTFFKKIINWMSFHFVRISSNLLTTFTYKRYFKDYFRS